MTIIMKENLKSKPAPDWSANLSRIVDLYEKDYHPIAFSAAKDSLTMVISHLVVLIFTQPVTAKTNV